jgi:hypothetical protein
MNRAMNRAFPVLTGCHVSSGHRSGENLDCC